MASLITSEHQAIIARFIDAVRDLYEAYEPLTKLRDEIRSADSTTNKKFYYTFNGKLEAPIGQNLLGGMSANLIGWEIYDGIVLGTLNRSTQESKKNYRISASTVLKQFHQVLSAVKGEPPEQQAKDIDKLAKGLGVVTANVKHVVADIVPELLKIGQETLQAASTYAVSSKETKKELEAFIGSEEFAKSVDALKKLLMRPSMSLVFSRGLFDSGNSGAKVLRAAIDDSNLLDIIFYSAAGGFKNFEKRIHDWSRDQLMLLSYGRLDVDELKKRMDLFRTGKILQVFRDVAESMKDTYEKSLAAAKKKPEAPEGAPLGYIAFGEKRLDDVPFEPDTPEEKRLLGALDDHVNSNKMIKDEDVVLIKSMMKKGMYPKIFKEPEGVNVYRGFSVSEEYLRKALKLKKGQKLPKKGKLDVTFRFTPWKGKAASSWTTTLKEAWDFADKGDGEWSIVMYAVPDENRGKFLDLRGGMYSVKGFENYSKEKEAIGMGTIRVYRVDWRWR